MERSSNDMELKDIPYIIETDYIIKELRREKERLLHYPVPVAICKSEIYDEFYYVAYSNIAKENIDLIESLIIDRVKFLGGNINVACEGCGAMCNSESGYKTIHGYICFKCNGEDQKKS